MNRTSIALYALVGAAAIACTAESAENWPLDPATGLRVPELGPVPALPEWPDNPVSATKEELGRAIFFDNRLSGSELVTCSNCHFSLSDFQSATPLDLPDRSYPNLSPSLPRHTPSLLSRARRPCQFAPAQSRSS